MSNPSQVAYSNQSVLLLLSGGQDSHKALEKLIQSQSKVYCLCIDGKQGKEKVGAQLAANQFNVPLQIVRIANFDEETWNPIKLMSRDLAMAYWALRIAKKNGATMIATGIKESDIQNPKLWWLKTFLYFCKIGANIAGIKLIHPLITQ